MRHSSASPGRRSRRATRGGLNPLTPSRTYVPTSLAREWDRRNQCGLMPSQEIIVATVWNTFKRRWTFEYGELPIVSRSGIWLATSGSIWIMSETPEEETDPLQMRTQALSVLEKALRDALAVVPIDQVMHTVTVMFPKAPVEIDVSRFHGRVQKVSVSMPEELTAAIRTRTGPGGFSRFVSEAAERRLHSELLGELLDEFDAELGPTPAELREQARREWPDYEE